MNRLIVSLMGTFNALIAVAIILVATVLTTEFSAMLGMSRSTGFVMGLIGGFVGAITICGILALAIMLEKDLRAINTTLKQIADNSAPQGLPLRPNGSVPPELPRWEN